MDLLSGKVCSVLLNFFLPTCLHILNWPAYQQGTKLDLKKPQNGAGSGHPFLLPGMKADNARSSVYLIAHDRLV